MDTDIMLESWETSTAFIVLLVIASLWSAVWKALALWKSARRSDTVWYVVLCILNTLGILEIIYIFLVARKKEQTTDVQK